MQNEEDTRRKWREYKAAWRKANPERARECYRETYRKHAPKIAARRKLERQLFAEWRKDLRASAGLDTPQVAKEVHVAATLGGTDGR